MALDLGAVRLPLNSLGNFQTAMWSSNRLKYWASGSP
jgi:hypothetical protein